MKLRYKISGGIVSVLFIVIATLAGVLAYNSPCEAPAASAKGVPTYRGFSGIS